MAHMGGMILQFLFQVIYDYKCNHPKKKKIESYFYCLVSQLTGSSDGDPTQDLVGSNMGRYSCAEWGLNSRTRQLSPRKTTEDLSSR